MKNSEGKAQMWDKFRDFFLRQINDSKNLTQHTNQHFTEAHQKTHQSVHNFTAYLAQLETLLSEVYIKSQHRENLHI
jgi:hypothetical protein